MPLQRRYSVTGQTPPDNVGIKEPKLQALDTSVQQTSCGLCEGGAAATGGDVVRKSSKRSATHLPSPSTPSSMELPTKIARLGLDTMIMDTEIEAALSDSTFDSDCDSTTFSLCSSGASTVLSETPPSSQTSSYLTELPIKVPLTLLTLPPEIRHQIYLHLPDIILPYPLIYCLSTFSNLKQHPLASVCTKIRSEALAIFYSYNTWIIKLEFKMMYDAFRDWIVRLGPTGAGCLRTVIIGIRGRLFRPQTVHSRDSAAIAGLAAQGFPMQDIMEYSPPDGDASFKIDLSEKYFGGRVETMRCDGTREAGEMARIRLQELVRGVWEKRCRGLLGGEDWLGLVEQFMRFTGCEI